MNYEGVIEQSFVGLKELVESGEEIIGYIYPHAPLELFMAHGFTPSLIRALPGVSGGFEESLQTFACSYIRNLYSQRTNGQFLNLAGLLFPGNTCDSLQNLGDVWRVRFPDDRVFRLTYPVTRYSQDDSTTKFLAEEIRLLSETISNAFNRPFLSESYERAVELVNDFRSSTQFLYCARVVNPKIIPYAEIVRFVRTFLTAPTISSVSVVKDAAASVRTTADKLGILDTIEAVRKAITIGDYTGVKLPDDLETPRIVIAGGMVEPQAIATLINDMPDMSDSVIVLDLLSFGFKTVFTESPSKSDDPYLAMAQSVLTAPGEPTHEGLSYRMDALKGLLSNLSIQGLIVCEQSFCDPDQFEAPSIERAASELGVKTVRIPLDPELSDRGRIETRIQTFLETLE
ncbi:MAG: R-phenyllactate dehydratase beta subunit [Candidatus Thorarchaeota archaeon AB_25]|nr:MAG: R-phenyllactate dehydratase beta subunit [Candidatus Thorarchaeota archaeon AB_25]